jgi:hypothetical protein
MQMAISMYQSSVPVFVRGLEALSAVIAKAEAHAAARKIDPVVLCGTRLYPDMFPLSRQVQIACDFGKGATARLAGADVPSWEDNDKTLADLKAKADRTVAYMQTFKASQIDGSEERDISLKIGGNPVTMKGMTYLLHFALPNFYFHSATAYDILRSCGVELGKRDFLGAVPGLVR